MQASTSSTYALAQRILAQVVTGCTVYNNRKSPGLKDERDTRPSDAMPPQVHLTSRQEMSGELRLKMAVVGGPGVGKTSLVRKFCKGTNTETYDPTIGYDWMSAQLDTGDHVVSNRPVRIVFWDSSHAEVDGSHNKTLFEGADAVLIVTTATSRSSLQWVDRWRREYETNTSWLEARPLLFLMVHKADLAGHIITEPGLASYARAGGYCDWWYTTIYDDHSVYGSVGDAVTGIAGRVLKRLALSEMRSALGMDSTMASTPLLGSTHGSPESSPRNRGFVDDIWSSALLTSPGNDSFVTAQAGDSFFTADDVRDDIESDDGAITTELYPELMDNPRYGMEAPSLDVGERSSSRGVVSDEVTGFFDIQSMVSRFYSRLEEDLLRFEDMSYESGWINITALLEQCRQEKVRLSAEIYSSNLAGSEPNPSAVQQSMLRMIGDMNKWKQALYKLNMERRRIQRSR